MAKAPSGGFRVGNVNYGRFSGVRPGGAANENLTEKARIQALKDAAAETEKMIKESTKDYKLNSGRAAYEKPNTSTGTRIAGAIASTAGRLGLRGLAGPVGALVGMTQPVGEGSDKPSGPLMSGEKNRGPSGGSLSAPNRSEPSRSGSSRGPSGPSGPNSGPSRSEGGSSNSRGPSGPSGPNSGPSSSTSSRGSGPAGPSGPNSGPSTSSSSASRGSGPGGPSGPNSGPSTSSSGSLGTSRFAKGSLVVAKGAKQSYFSKDAIARTRAKYGSSPARGKKK